MYKLGRNSRFIALTLACTLTAWSFLCEGGVSGIIGCISWVEIVDLSPLHSRVHLLLGHFCVKGGGLWYNWMYKLGRNSRFIALTLACTLTAWSFLCEGGVSGIIGCISWVEIVDLSPLHSRVHLLLGHFCVKGGVSGIIGCISWVEIVDLSPLHSRVHLLLGHFCVKGGSLV